MISDKRLQQALEDVKESAESIWEYERIKDKTKHENEWRSGLACHKESLYNGLRGLLEELDLRGTQDIINQLDELEDKEFDNITS